MLLLCGCTPPEYPAYQLNPDPKDPLEVMIKLHDAPGDLRFSDASTTYRIINPSCLPETNNFEGVQHAPQTHTVRHQLRKVDASTYSFTAYRDQMKSSEYYGRGICNWKLTLAFSHPDLPSSPNRIYFTIAATPKELQQKGGLTTYFRIDRTSKSIDGAPRNAQDFTKERFEMLPESEKANIFSMTIKSP